MHPFDDMEPTPLETLRAEARLIAADGGRALQVRQVAGGFSVSADGETMISRAGFPYILAFLRGFAACQRGPGLFAAVSGLDFGEVNRAL